MNGASPFPKANVLGIGIDAVNMKEALARIECDLRQRRKGYICLVGVHGVMEAHRDRSVAAVFREAALALPDGMPTVWMGHHQGHKQMERVAGPDLMLEVIRQPQFRNATHFLCGGKEGIAEELRRQLTEKYPFIKILGTFTPPWEKMSAHEEEEFVASINRLRPDIVWMGISTPKQDRFMARYLPVLDTTLMVGVGAAFDFHTGHISDCADWIKRAGLQWLDRLIQDPKHLWIRYLRNNPAFLFYTFLQLTGLRSYAVQARKLHHPAKQPAQSLQS